MVPLIAELRTVMGHNSGVAGAGAAAGGGDDAAAKSAPGGPEPVFDHPSQSFDGGPEGKQPILMMPESPCPSGVARLRSWSTVAWAVVVWPLSMLRMLRVAMMARVLLVTVLERCGTGGAVQGFKYTRAGLDVNIEYGVALAT